MAARKNQFIVGLIIIFLLFSIAVAFDVSPYLRGPAIYPPDWRWSYQFANTINKIWAPLFVIFVIVIYFQKSFSLNETKYLQKEKIILTGIIVLSFVFQLSVLFFNRADIGVLLERIVKPDLNGYFTTAIGISNVYLFLHNYTSNVLQYSMHAQGHPPGAVLFFYVINKFFLLLPFLNNIVSFVHPSQTDVGQIWAHLLVNEKLGALLSSFLIIFLSSLSIIPLYFSVKKLYNLKTAIVSSFLYMLIPSINLFIPLNDVLLPLFSIGSFYYLVEAIQKKEKRLFFIAGLIFSFGLFFSLSLLPFLLFYLCFLIINKKRVKDMVVFILGIFVIPVILLIFYQVNIVTLFLTLMSGLPPERKYTTWVIYNIYDFFIFSGIPILSVFFITFFTMLSTIFKKHRLTADKVFLSFFVMLFVLDISGAVRGEVARIWIPFYPFLAIIAARFFIKKEFNGKQFIIIFLLMSLQVLLMQEFWVTLW